ncbi:DUF438 domain-containing protein [Treponema sp.]
MSELIQNDAHKQEELKRIIERLHEGESVSKVKKDFDSLVKNVSAEEIASMEQALMKAGMPAEEIQRLCEVHVAVFESSLEKQGKSEKVSGHPVNTFMEENKAARLSLKNLRAASRGITFSWMRNPESIDKVQSALLDFRKILIHYTRKENQLFPFLEAKGFDAPSKVMWGKHDEVRALFKEAEEARAASNWKALRKAISGLAGKTSKMFFMEEHILFPAALRKLDEKDWIAVRRGEAAIGYAWVSPGGAWDPDIAESKLPQEPQQADPGVKQRADARSASTEASPIPAPDSLHLGEGWMTKEQIDLMLKVLPLDLSFVDEHDRVLYYSDGRERIFPRSPAVIGRNVANCHPPKSVDIVQKIVQAFRNKEKTEAEFWIEMGGKFLHIRYFPVYDAEGNYKGTVELSQDLTDIRALEGQRRLLDWE